MEFKEVNPQMMKSTSSTKNVFRKLQDAFKVMNKLIDKKNKF